MEIIPKISTKTALNQSSHLYETLAAKKPAGVAPEVNLCEHVTCMPVPSVNKEAHSGFETQKETSPKVQNRGITDPIKRNYVLQKLKKNSCETLIMVTLCSHSALLKIQI